MWCKWIGVGSGSDLMVQIFAKYESQRQWIADEILSALVKVPEQTSINMGYQ